jgi:hypothetical protein
VAESVRLTITLDTETLTVDEFAAAVGDTVGVLIALDEAASGGKRTITFRLMGLSFHSPPQVDLVAEPRNGHVATAANLAALNDGIGFLRQAEIPPYFSDDVLSNLKRLAERPFAVTVLAPDEHVEVRVSSPVGTDIERAVQAGYALGGVEGILTTISIAKGAIFAVSDAVTGSSVRCSLPSGQEWQRRALGLFGQKVIVTGDIRRDGHGRPVAMRNVVGLASTSVHDRAVPDPSLVGSFGGIDVDTKEYLRDLRGE